MIALAREGGGADPCSHQDGRDADLAADRLDQRAADRRQARLRLRPGEMAGPRAGDAAIEIDRGTGHPLADLARTVGPGGSVLGGGTATKPALPHGNTPPGMFCLLAAVDPKAKEERLLD